MVYAEAEQTPRERRRRANEARILEAALRIIVEEGFAALSIKRLAADVDYTPGALYRYFDSKDAIVAAVAAQVIEEVRRQLERAAGSVPPSEPLARIFALTDAWLAFSHRAPHRFALLTAMLNEPRRLLTDTRSAGAVAAATIGALAPLRGALSEAADRALLDPGDDIERTLLLFSGIAGALAWRKQEGRVPVDADRLARTMIHALLRGFGASAERLAAATERGTP